MALEVREIDYLKKVIVTNDDRRFPIDGLFDRAGLVTSDPASAIVCVAGKPGGWLSVRLADFDPRQLQ